LPKERLVEETQRHSVFSSPVGKITTIFSNTSLKKQLFLKFGLIFILS